MITSIYKVYIDDLRSTYVRADSLEEATASGADRLGVGIDAVIARYVISTTDPIGKIRELTERRRAKPAA